MRNAPVRLLGILAAAWILLPVGTGAEHRVKLIIGMHYHTAAVTQWWHSPSTAVGSNLDLVAPDSTFTIGRGVSWQSVPSSGYPAASVRVTMIAPVGDCKQTRVKVTRTTDTVNMGSYYFFHLDETLAPTTSWTTSAGVGTFTIRYGGKIASTDAAGCMTAAHLHQGGNTNIAPLYRNWNLQSLATSSGGEGTVCYRNGTDPCILYPTGDYTNRWEHEYRWN